MPWQQIVRWVAIVAWILHGLGTLANVAVSFGLPVGFPDHKPLLPALASTPLRYVAGVIWLAVAALYLAAAVGLIMNAPWWPTAAWIAAPISFVMILLYWPAVPAGEQYGGQLVNVATVVYLLFVPK